MGIVIYTTTLIQHQHRIPQGERERGKGAIFGNDVWAKESPPVSPDAIDDDGDLLKRTIGGGGCSARCPLFRVVLKYGNRHLQIKVVRVA